MLSQLARGIFEGRGLPYFLLQAATTMILVLAANTGFNGAPRLAQILAEHGCRLGIEFLGPKTLRTGHPYAFISTREKPSSAGEASGRPPSSRP